MGLLLLIQNFITLGKYLINKTLGFTNVRYIEYEFDYEDEEIDCYCNLCYTTRGILLFPARRLMCN